MAKITREIALQSLRYDARYARHEAERRGPTHLEHLVLLTMKVGGVPYDINDTSQAMGLKLWHLWLRKQVLNSDWMLATAQGDVITLLETEDFIKLVDSALRYGKPYDLEFWEQTYDPSKLDDLFLYLEKVGEAVARVKAYQAQEDAYLKEQAVRFKIIRALGPVMAHAIVPTDESCMVLNLEQWFAASRFQETIDMVDNYAEKIIEVLGIDLPGFNTSILSSQANHLVANHNLFLNLACDIITEISVNTDHTLDILQAKTEEEVRVQHEQNKAALEAATADLIDPVLGLDDAVLDGLEDASPHIDQLREIYAKFQEDILEEENAYLAEVATASEVFNIKRDEVVFIVPFDGVAYNLTGPGGGNVAGLVEAMKEFHALGESEEEPEEPDDG